MRFRLHRHHLRVPALERRGDLLEETVDEAEHRGVRLHGGQEELDLRARIELETQTLNKMGAFN